MGPPTGGDARARITKLDDVLRAVPYQYQDKARLRNDVANLLQHCHTLQPQTGTFSGNGRQVTLFYLYGVLPINYRGATYNIPVTIYFDPPYPRSAPRCFVTPTDKMAVSKNHPNVDQGGMVYCPFLSQWTDRCSLDTLVGTISSLFAQNPPVYSTEHSASVTRPQAAASVVQPVQPTPVAHVVARPVTTGGQQASRKEELVRKTTEALKQRWRFVVEPLVEEVNGQLDRGTELRKEAKRVDEELAALKAEEARHKEQVQEVSTLEAELSAFVSANEGKDPDPDDLREDLDADSRQVLDLLAEELALDEFLVALEELLGSKKIGIDDFMREVRDVSRKRFMCQVLRQKTEATVRKAAEETTKAPVVVIGRPVTD